MVWFARATQTRGTGGKAGKTGPMRFCGQSAASEEASAHPWPVATARLRPLQGLIFGKSVVNRYVYDKPMRLGI